MPEFRVIKPCEEYPKGQSPFMSNQVRTSKYTILNFLPIGLYQAFTLATNFYFLIIAILQSIKLISPLGPMTAIAPLVFVVGIGLLREALEDRQRRISDQKSNFKTVSLWRQGQLMEVTWQDIKVGDLIKVCDKENFPADGVLLSTSEDNGSCLIDTANLDGEISLKSRMALACTADIRSLSEPIPTFQVNCEPPNVDLYKFTGKIDIKNENYGLDVNQLLPRGSTLRNTKWIIMVVAYTGHETKMMLNAKEPHHKTSNVIHMMNKNVIFIFVVQVILCIIASICHTTWWKSGNFERIFVPGNNEQEGAEGFLDFLTFVVLLNTLIPSSLVVSIEVVKLIHSLYITWDLDMTLENGEGAISNTSTLVEELGQVRYLFSDKTGTLTQNLMEFKKCSIAGKVYAAEATISKKKAAQASRTNSRVQSKQVSVDIPGRTSSRTGSKQVSDPMGRLQSGAMGRVATMLGINLGGHAKPPPPPVVLNMPHLVENHEDPALTLDELRTTGLDRTSEEAKLILAMALCHTVVCEIDSNGKYSYHADSTDEAALVLAASKLGASFRGCKNRKIQIELSGAQGKSEYEILHVLAFNSTRKRMSVIVQNVATKQIQLICKGADCVVLELCSAFGPNSRSTITEHLNEFASDGLRTLVFAERNLTEDEYLGWSRRYKEAELAMDQREVLLQNLVTEIEQKLTYIASTAIEDKLQEGVPETIAKLLRAGIKVWVLTGDKVETAIQIGRSCKVISKAMVEVHLLGSDASELANNLAELSKVTTAKEQPRALIIDGASLSFALMPENRLAFLQLALDCAAVVVCRMSPLQKALVVDLVKEEVEGVTMAVGDGANDVSMIRAAHVGIGVMGQEGHQAVRSSDYAIQEFQDLDRLLLYHGRLSYFRVTQCINYYFYKNIVFTTPQFIYGAFSLFSGATFFDSLYIAAFNLCYTALPVVSRAVMEKRLPESISDQFPELYLAGNVAWKDQFSFKIVATIGFFGVLHAIILTLVPLYCLDRFQGVALTSNAVDGIATYIGIIFTVSLVIFFQTCNWTAWAAFFYLGSLAFFVLSAAVFSGMPASGGLYGGWTILLSSSSFWLTIVLSISACILPWMAYQGWTENFLDDKSDPVHILRRARVFNKEEMMDLANERLNSRATTNSKMMDFSKEIVKSKPSNQK